MKIASVQWNTLDGDIEFNYRKAKAFLERLKTENIDLVVFPEVFLTGYDMNFIKRSNTEYIYTKLKELKEFGITISGSIPYKEKDRLYNRFFFITKDKEIYYDKIHLFSPTGEDKVFKSGKKQVIIEYKGFYISPVVCYDIRFTKLFYNLQKEKIDIILVSAQWPLSRKEHWISLLKARAIEVQSYVIASNRTGKGKKIDFAGRSLIISPRGKVLLNLGEKEGFIIWDIKREDILSYKEEIPIQKDMKSNISIDKIKV